MNVSLPDEAGVAYREALALFESNDQHLKAGSCALSLGEMAAEASDHAGALAAYEQGLAVYQAGGELFRSGRAHHEIADALDNLDRSDEAVAHLRDALCIFVFLEDAAKVADSQYRLGRALTGMDEPAEALPLLIAATATFKESESYSEAAEAELCIGHALLNLYRKDEALATLQRVRAVFDGLGMASRANWTDLTVIGHFLAVDDVAEAEKRFRALIAAAELRGDESVQQTSRTGLARLLVKATRYDEAVAIMESMSPDGWGTDLIGQARHLVVLGICEFHCGSQAAASEHFTAVLASGPIAGAVEQSAVAHEYLALIAKAAGSEDRAQSFMGQAIALYLSSGEDADARRVAAMYFQVTT